MTTLLAAVVVWLAARPGAPLDDAATAADVLARCGCQTDLPGVASSASASDPSESRLRLPIDVDGGRRALPPPVALPAFLPWLLVAVGAALALVWILRGWHRAPTPPPPAVDATRAGRRERPAAERLADPDALAREGRFAEAVHALLLAALAEVVRRSRPAPPASLTSRELLSSARLPAAARSSLGELVAGVEPALFGGRRPGPPEYEACAGHYRQFLAAWR